MDDKRTDKVSTAPEDVAHMAAELDLSGASSDFSATLRALSAEVERLKVALRASHGYLMNALIDLDNDTPRKTAAQTLRGGIAVVSAALGE
jgi:hypothetical protein